MPFSLLGEGWTVTRNEEGSGNAFLFIDFSFYPHPAAVLAKQERGKEMSFLRRCDKGLFASERGSVLNK